jgi:hypothetical protein
MSYTLHPILPHTILLKFGKFGTYFEFLKISSSITLNCECFLSVGCRSLSFRNFIIHFLMKTILYPSPLQILFLLTQLLMFKFKSTLLKPKPKIKFNEVLFEFSNIHNNHLTQLGMVSITLKCQNKNIFKNNLNFSKLFDMIFASFECICSQICN